MPLLHWTFPLLIATLLSARVRGFTFTTSTPTQCDQWTVSWNGGNAPYQLILVPTISINGGHIQNISIPSTASGSYTFQLNEPAGLEFIATMYDSSGFGSGGTTPVLTVGSSSDDSCLTTDLNYDFYFSINPTSNPNQCSSMSITWDSTVTYPVNLYGLIPSGSAFSLPISQSSGTTTYDWTVDISSGSDFLLFMSDAGRYQTGGSTGLLTVGGGNTNCMDSSSPSSATASSSSSSTSASTASSASSSTSVSVTSASASNSGLAASASASIAGVGGTSSGGNVSGGSNSKSSSHIGAIVGGAVGGVAFLLLLLILLVCCIRKRSKSSHDSDSGMKSYGLVFSEKPKRKSRGPMGILGSRGRIGSDETMGGTGLGVGGRSTEMSGHNYEPVPFRYPSPPPTGRVGSGLGLGAAGGMGVLAAAGGEKRQSGTGNGYGALNRQSEESTHTYPSLNSTGQTNTNTPPNGTQIANQGHGALPPSSYSNTGNTDSATLGHETPADPPFRHNSIRKSPSGPSSPVLGGRTSGEVGRPLPVPGIGRNEGPRFVQHEDSGEVVDLPPRYDQLRARNPDQA